MAIFFVFSVFAAQLVRIQGLDAAAVAAEAVSERTGSEVIPAPRGRIIDIDGDVLAESIERRTVTVDQTAVPTYKRRIDGVRVTVGVAGAAEQLAPILGRSVASLTEEMTGDRLYYVLAKDVSVLTWRRINDLGIPGIYSERTTQRSYPEGSIAASLVGFVLDDGTPGGGVELAEQERLRGVNGAASYERSATGRVIPGGNHLVTPAQPGRDVQLTIDANIQWYAQNALAQQISRMGAASGTVVVMNAKTGELVALASYPTYDPNKIAGTRTRLTNAAFTDMFEPGSTNKIITIAAALSEGAVTPDTPVVIPNRMPRSDKIFKDSHDHPTLYRTVSGVLAESSNIGTVLTGEKLSASTLNDYFTAFGLGSKSDINFPGEQAGIITPADKLNGSQRFTVMYGQGMSVTAIQSVGAMQTIANGGIRVEPTLVHAVADESGELQPTELPQGTRVVSPEVASQVGAMLEAVTSEDGTARNASIPGYRVAGKTGTADRYDERLGRYSGVTSSFIGYAPADDPELVVGVIIDRPSTGFWGGTVAAPVFTDVMTYALADLQIPPTGTTAPELVLSVEPEEALSNPAVLDGTKRPSG